MSYHNFQQQLAIYSWHIQLAVVVGLHLSSVYHSVAFPLGLLDCPIVSIPLVQDFDCSSPFDRMVGILDMVAYLLDLDFDCNDAFVEWHPNDHHLDSDHAHQNSYMSWRNTMSYFHNYLYSLSFCWVWISFLIYPMFVSMFYLVFYSLILFESFKALFVFFFFRLFNCLSINFFDAYLSFLQSRFVLIYGNKSEIEKIIIIIIWSSDSLEFLWEFLVSICMRVMRNFDWSIQACDQRTRLKTLIWRNQSLCYNYQ